MSKKKLCHWIRGDRGRPTKCGAPVMKGVSLCAKHWRLDRLQTSELHVGDHVEIIWPEEWVDRATGARGVLHSSVVVGDCDDTDDASENVLWNVVDPSDGSMVGRAYARGL